MLNKPVVALVIYAASVVVSFGGMMADWNDFYSHLHYVKMGLPEGGGRERFFRRHPDCRTCRHSALHGRLGTRVIVHL
jgi:hypothetical protein